MMEVIFAHTLFAPHGSEDVDVEAEVDLFAEVANLKSVKAETPFELTLAHRVKLEKVAVEYAIEIWRTP